MQAITQYLEQEDPLEAMRWANMLDDINNAHERLDEYMGHRDEWLVDFEDRMTQHAQISMWMYTTINELRQTVKELRTQVALLTIG